ncbi:DNA-binding transcriptional ArsR family regulator [Actinoalloteichus hoggarensis]|uniref:Helix-turn-helix domain protein n=1 Tax=Actinoalloteichus hoggarensis TaxID=1470176 RepID=A0A221W6V8_9PSEU|nr:winged helix-turn-helix domain-containing protein [Actinoalloteichus hoggarensis]ASO21403.1 Helix-turn-helix domain protein [Actinoalloteichus hoggarensis]MBB5921336.1 DNA-binding transcriptional ArsR family regulator [Actinoalloteichus hoggarensis]
MNDIEQRVAELETRVLRLEAELSEAASSAATAPPGPAEGGGQTTAPPPSDDVSTGDDGPPPAGRGVIGYQGETDWAGGVRWQITLSAEGVMSLPLPPAAGVLSALGHPGRAAIVRRLLASSATAAELQESAGLNSTGQFYHHLRTLTGVGLVEQDGRGSYRVPLTRLIPVAVLLLAAGDIAGSLR